MTKLYWGHLEFLFQGQVPSAPVGSATFYKSSLDKIAHILPNIFTASGDVDSVVKDATLNNLATAATDLVTMTTARDIEKTAKESAEKKLQTWTNNGAAIIQILEDRKKFLQEIHDLTADKVIAVPDAAKKGTLQTDIDNIKVIVADVSGLNAKKDALKAVVRAALLKFQTSTWVGATEIEKFAGAGNSNFHWGDGNKRTSAGNTWEHYVDAINVDGAGTENSYDETRDGLLMGLHETVVPELLRRHKAREGGVVKKTLIDYMNDADLKCDGFFKQNPQNPKAIAELDKIDADYKNHHYEDTINGLVDAKDWDTILGDIRTYIGAWNKTTAIADVRTWAKAKLNAEKPLDGLDLNGATKATLRALTAGTAITTAAGRMDIWNGYKALASDTDGNCFLNSFAIWIIGKQITDTTAVNVESQQNIAQRLRVAMCLNLMSESSWLPSDALTLKRPDSKYDGWNANVWEIHRKLLKAKYASVSYDDVTEETYNPTTDKWSANANYATANDGSMATNKTWLSNQDISYVSLLLSRPVTVVSKGTSASTGGFLATQFTWELSNTPKFTHEEPWVIWNSTGGHYEPLIQPDNHKEGKIKFNVDDVDFDKSTATAATVTFTFGSGADDKVKASLLEAGENTRLINDGLPTATSLVITLNYNGTNGERAWYDEKEAIFANKKGRRFMVTFCHVDKLTVASDVATVPYGDFIEVDLLPLPKFNNIEAIPGAIVNKDTAHIWYINQLKSKIRWFSMDADEKTTQDWKAFNALVVGDSADDWEAEIAKTSNVADAKKFVETDHRLFALVEELNRINSLDEIRSTSLPTGMADVDEAKQWLIRAIISCGWKRFNIEVKTGGVKANDFKTHLGITGGGTWVDAINAQTDLPTLKTFIDTKTWIEALKQSK